MLNKVTLGITSAKYRTPSITFIMRVAMWRVMMMSIMLVSFIMSIVVMTLCLYVKCCCVDSFMFVVLFQKVIMLCVVVMLLCLYAKCYVDFLCHYTMCCSAESHYSVCRYYRCRYAECCGAPFSMSFWKEIRPFLL